MRRREFFALAALLTLAVPALAQEQAGGDTAVTRGQALFDEKCIVCHTNGGGDHLGPDLAGVVDRRPREWIRRFIVEPDRVLAEGDPVALELLKKYNEIPMPNLGVTPEEADAFIAYIAGAGPAATARAPVVLPAPEMLGPQWTILLVFLLIAGVIVLVFGVVGLSTGTPAQVNVSKAFQLRRVLFIIGIILSVGLLAATLPQAPYARADTKADRIVYVAARQFDFVFSEEPIVTAEDVARTRRIAPLELAAGELVEFRVTSLDVTHGFGVYGPQRQLLVQTQAMPGYVNRLLVRLERPGPYLAVCMEYCAGGHHLMQAPFIVNDLTPAEHHDQLTQAPLIAN